MSCDKKLIRNLAAEVDKRRFMGLLNPELAFMWELNLENYLIHGLNCSLKNI